MAQSSKDLPTKKCIAIFNINSFLVEGSLQYFYSDNRPPEVLATAKIFFAKKSALELETFFKTMTTAVKDVAAELHTNGRFVPSEIHVFLSSPWLETQTRVATVEKNIPFFVTSAFVEDIVQKELSRIPSGEIVESQIMNIELNGYTVEKPFGKKARSISLSLFVGISEAEIINGIRQALAHSYNERELAFHSALFSNFLAVRDVHKIADSFIFADLGGELANVLLAEDGNFLESMSFPLGTHSLLRTLASALNKTPEEIESLVKLYYEGALEQGARAKVEHMLGNVRSEWTKNFWHSIDALTKHSLPKTFVIMAEQPHGALIESLVSHPQFRDYSLSGNPFNVILLDEDDRPTFGRIRSQTTPSLSHLIHSFIISRLNH